jgi:hypothetical protein
MQDPFDRQAQIVLYGRAHTLLVAGLQAFPRAMWQYRSSVDPWTIHEILIHITDSEANSYARLRRLVAEPGQSVMAYDENLWARALNYHAQDPDDALELFRWLRGNSYKLLLALHPETWSNTILHPENGPMTMDDWLATYARHVPDHLDQMERVHQAWLNRPI